MPDTTTYAGNFVYKGTGSGLSLEYVLTPEGMFRNPASPEYHYFIKDHLGNTRVTLTDADHDGVLDFNSSEILQTADYYPFGMMHYSQGGANKYLYNGKELQEEGIADVGLDWYDYGARFYDPSLGRFPSLDPIADKFYWVSPYNFAENSPIANIDFWGLQKVYFMAGINKKPGFEKAKNAANSTTIGTNFLNNLRSQNTL